MRKSKRKYKYCSLRAVNVLKSLCNFSLWKFPNYMCFELWTNLAHFSSRIHLFMVEIVPHRLRQSQHVWNKERPGSNFSWKTCYCEKIMKSRFIECRYWQAMKKELLDPLIITCLHFAQGFHEFLFIFFHWKSVAGNKIASNEINGNNVDEICFKFLSVFGLSISCIMKWNPRMLW